MVEEIELMRLRDEAFEYLPEVKESMLSKRHGADKEQYYLSLYEATRMFRAAKTRNMTTVEIHAAQLLEAIVFYATYDPEQSYDGVTPQEMNDFNTSSVANAVAELAEATERDIKFDCLALTSKQIASNTDKPWLIHDPKDPNPEQPWFTPARYFAREIIKEDSSLLDKRTLLTPRIVDRLNEAGIKKRGGKHPFSPDTVNNALKNVNLS